MTEQALVNGVDVAALRETINAVKGDRSLGEVTFRVDGRWQGGFRLSAATGSMVQAGIPDYTRSGKFTMESDEPAALLGSDSAVSPGEHLLQALAGCYTVTLAANAASRGIELHGYELSLETDFDLAGFLGVDSDQQPGAQAIRVSIDLDAPGATSEELADLVAVVEARSPIRDTLVRPILVETTLTKDS